MIILNEKEYIENKLETKDINHNQIGKFLFMYSKYLSTELGYDKNKIYKELNNFMQENYKGYQEYSWMDSLDKFSKNAHKYKLLKCDGIYISQKELDKIRELRNKTLERLAFTLLCLAKFNNYRSESNNDWTNYTNSEIFKMACVTANEVNKNLKINSLYEKKYLEYAKRVDNLNLRVTFVDNTASENNYVLFIFDFRKLGNEYRLYNGERYFRCNECEILTKRVKNNQCYCNNCRKDNPSYEKQSTKVIKCIDCGSEFEIESKNTKTNRCKKCQNIKNKEKYIKYNSKRRGLTT